MNDYLSRSTTNIILLLGRGTDRDGGLGDRLHRVRVRRPHGVHRHPPQDEAQEALQLPAEEGHVRRDGPHLPGPLSLSLSDIQSPVLDRCTLHKVSLWF